MVESGGRRRVFACAALLIVLGALSIGAQGSEIPVVLVYGFQPVPGFRASQLWEDIAETLSGTKLSSAERIEIARDHTILYLPAASSQHRAVVLSDYALAYEPTVRNLFFYTARFSDELDALAARFGWESFDVVGHSMGGLIARTYVEISDFHEVLGTGDFVDYGIESRQTLRTLITLATPHHGLDLARSGQWFNPLSRQLAPGSKFLRLLNAQQWVGAGVASLNPAVRYVSLAGQTCVGCGIRVNEADCLRTCIDAALHWQGSDLVVMMSSAYLPGAENTALVGLDHVAMHTDPLVAECIERILDQEQLPAACYATEKLSAQGAGL